jgi:thymidine phosphorylase
LFERVGRGLGLVIEAHATDGSRPIGRGVGPSLEVRDVLAVLDNDPHAPADLREKALFFAGRILAWDPGCGSEACARARAAELLTSGAARSALERIIEAQGRRRSRVLPGKFTHTVKADHSGSIAGMDGWAVAAVARGAGAPNDQRAGLDLLRGVGDSVRAGDPLYIIHAGSEADLAIAVSLAAKSKGYSIAN